MRRRFVPLTLIVLALTLALPACGVRFGEPEKGTEVFKDIELTGERSVGSELALTLELAPVYQVPLEIACLYEDGDKLTDDQEKIAFFERATRVGDTVLPPVADARPDEDEDEVPTQTLSYRFRVAEPGSYILVCLTPAAPDNGISLMFNIR